MIFKNSFLFLIFKIITGVLGVASIGFLVKGFKSDGYGNLVILITYATLYKVFILHWISKSLTRFGDLESDNRLVIPYLSKMHLLISIVSILISIVAYLAFFQIEIFLVVLIAISDSLRECFLEIEKATVRVVSHGVKSTINSLQQVALSVCVFVYGIDLSSYCIFSSVFCILLFFKFWVIGFNSEKSPYRFLELLKFSYPLSLSDSISQVTFATMRYSISIFHDIEFLGKFSAIYDLLQRCITSYTQIINSALFPLIRRAWDRHDKSAVAKICKINTVFLILPVLFLSSLVCIYSDEILNYLNLENGFDEKVFMAIIVLAVGLNRFKVFQIDLFFILEKSSKTILENMIISMSVLLTLVYTLGHTAKLWQYALFIFVSYGMGLIVALLRLRKELYRFIPTKVALLCALFYCSIFLINLELKTSDAFTVVQLTIAIAMLILVSLRDSINDSRILIDIEEIK